MWKRLKAHFDTVEKREQWGWCIYDWANAAYVTSAAAVFVGPYITSLAKEESCREYSNGACTWCGISSACINTYNSSVCIEGYECDNNGGWCCDVKGQVPLGGIHIGYGSFYAFIIAAAVVVQIIMLPILAAMADYSGNTKKMFMATTYVSAITVSLIFFAESAKFWWMAGVLYFISTVFFGASSVFYDSFLNMIAPEEDRTILSSKGYGIGYIGGGLFLAIIYHFYENTLTLRIIIGATGIWWILFSGITFTFLREHSKPEEEGETLLGGKGKERRRRRNACIEGLRQLWESLRVIRRLPYTILFLIAAAFYNDGIQTVMSMTSVFGTEALGLSSLQLGITILMVQFVAFFGAIGFGFIAKKIGDKYAIIITLVVWVISVTVMFFVKNYWEFMIVAFVVGLVLGGSQALSRAMFAKMVPAGYESQLFSFYQLSQRGTSWMGPLAYGPGVLFLAGFLVLGTILFCFVSVDKAKQQANQFSKNLPDEPFTPVESSPLVG